VGIIEIFRFEGLVYIMAGLVGCGGGMSAESEKKRGGS
jgi:hypothetical protein